MFNLSEAKTGWDHCHPSYEEHYLQDIPVGTVEETVLQQPR
jgi:alpha-glucosidase